MRPWHIVVVVLVFLLFFGIPKLPELARSIGRSLRIFKSETKDLLHDDVRTKSEAKNSGPDLNEAKPADTEAKRPEQSPPLTGDVISPEQREKR